MFQPLPEPMPSYCKETSTNLKSKYNNLHSEKCIWICLCKMSAIVRGKMCLFVIDLTIIKLKVSVFPIVVKSFRGSVSVVVLPSHYSDVIMSAMASQITGVSVVC